MLSSCKRSADFECGENFNLSVKFMIAGKNVSSEYTSIYGIGKDSVLFVQIRPNGSYVNMKDTSISLPLDLNSDTVKYRFIRKDLSEDTLHISYSRDFGIIEKDCFFCTFNKVKGSKFSTRLIDDGFELDKVYSDFFYDDFIVQVK